MFQQHTFIYTTFHPADRVKAARVIAELAGAHPDRVFAGRHKTTDTKGLAETLSCSSLTLILESEKTGKSPEVAKDIEVSLAKAPPNQILRLMLPLASSMPEESLLSKSLVDRGVEVVSCVDAVVADALDRIDLLSRYEPKLRQSAKTKITSGDGCGR